ncbi:MAG TPA: hypothetical protein VL860_14045, partial [Planctomycetota bacterium]|nr:hypothetical protein [Planctomycetota bacterium]
MGTILVRAFCGKNEKLKAEPHQHCHGDPMPPSCIAGVVYCCDLLFQPTFAVDDVGTDLEVVGVLAPD